ncbi:glycoside hydrolase family 1 protein [Novosphingobium sp. PY1]|uniref:glycoside hydrolase family 1 protein n=1 Tax=Novosphingobium sp. PY1 TaxID=1882221 RepID=UPI001A900166|nr:family 1 glycosylhydrolase [Novosphingobium sp. PY1]
MKKGPGPLLGKTLNAISGVNRREVLMGSVALGLAANSRPAIAGREAPNGRKGTFPSGFLWGASTAGHQVEGNNLASDTWALEHLNPTNFTEPSGDACDSFHRWPLDLDIVRDLGLNSFRFSVEWARIEPEAGEFSVAMLDHYKAMVEGCRERGLKPLVSFNHFTCPRWFAMRGGWINPDAPSLFARYCDRLARHLGESIERATTLNEPNLMLLLRYKLPSGVFAKNDVVQAAAIKAYGSSTFVSSFIENEEQSHAVQPILMEGHRQAKAAIKAARSDLPVGVTLAIEDDQPFGEDSQIAKKRAMCYDDWLRVAREDDFIGVQNYERARIGPEGQMSPPAGAVLTDRGAEIYPPSLAGAVRYAWSQTKVPVLVTEHGIGTSDDRQRAGFIPASLQHLAEAIAQGVPVLGYCHWSLLDNFEWIFGYTPKFGLVEVNRTTFARTPKPSAHVLAGIARKNAV